MIYGWKGGSRLSEDPQVVGERLEALREQAGSLVAQVVVEDARDVFSPLHPLFEWDDARAAEEFRLDQARYIIRSVVVKYDDSPPETAPARAFVVVSNVDSENVYTSTVIAMSDERMRREVLNRAFRELSALERKYQDLQELVGVFRAIHAAQERALTLV